MTVAPTPLHDRASHRSRLVAAAVLALFLVAFGVLLLLMHYDVFQRSSSSGGGVQGSGVAATETRAVPPFGSVELAGSNVVVVRVGSTRSVVVRGDDNLLRRVTTRVLAGRLVIGNVPGSFTTSSPMSVEVGVPSLDALSLSGSGVIAVRGIESRRLGVALPGSGVVRASGTVTRLDVTLSGSGDAQLSGLAAQDVHAIVSGSGRIIVNVARDLEASVPGSGAIVYTGNPGHVSSSITGSGAVTRG